MRSGRNRVFRHPGTDHIVLSRSASQGQHRATGFAQHYLGDAAEEEAPESLDALSFHHDQVGFQFLFGV